MSQKTFFYSLLFGLCLTTGLNAQSRGLQWEPLDIELNAKAIHAWWDFPVTATFKHLESGREIEVEGFYDGQDRYVIRFAAPLSGSWEYVTTSADDGLNQHLGTIQIAQPGPIEIDANPNLRGHLKISPQGRSFQHADGTPFLLLADTCWSINTQRCGLGENRDGRFYQYLDDRKAKGFSMILMSYMHGFGDTVEPHGQRNEGGYPFPEGEVQHLNSGYFTALDDRMDALWQAGMAVGVHPTWFGKLNCFFDYETAERISCYLAVRYGAYNGLWSLSGEYQYALKDCGWTTETFTKLGNAVASHNPYGHPLSIHPSGRINWPVPHHAQSSRAFHNDPWLDHHWLQTGQKITDLPRVPERLAEVRALTPTRPAFLAESFYERATDDEHAYHARWQCWTAMLSGAAGYGYGAFGVWNFYDPADPHGETGKKTEETVPWPQALSFAGSGQIRHAREILSGLEWWELSPAKFERGSTPPGAPKPRAVALLTSALTATKESPAETPNFDVTAPTAAHTPHGDWIIYLPRGDASQIWSIDLTVEQTKLTGARISHKSQAEPKSNVAVQAYWFDPRTAERTAVDLVLVGRKMVDIPPRPSDDDWVFVVVHEVDPAEHGD